MFFCFITFICGALNSWMHRWTTRVSSECTCVSPGPSMYQLGSRVTRGTASWSPWNTITTNHRLMTRALILRLKWVMMCVILYMDYEVMKGHYNRAQNKYYLKHRYECCMIKYSTRGGVEWQIQHEAKPSAVFATRPHLECCIVSYNTSIRCFYWFVGVAWEDWLLRLNPRSLLSPFSAGCFDRMDSQSDAEKQTNPVVSPSLLY